MASVTFDPAVGGNGSTVSDDSNATTGLGNGGHRTRFVPALGQIVAIANTVITKAAEALASANTAVNAPGTSATSTTSLSVTVASKSFTLAQTGKAFAVGQSVVIARTSAPGTTLMVGRITAFTSGTGAITVDATAVVGSGTFTDWTISLASEGAGSAPTSRQILAGGIATGGGNLTADRTITVTKAAGADIAVATDDAKAVTSKALADASLISLETDTGTIVPTFTGTFSRKVTLSTNRIMGAPSGCKEGMTYALSVIQDGTGSRLVTSWNAAYDWGSIGTPTLSTGANKRDIVFLYCYDSATPKFAASFWKAA